MQYPLSEEIGNPDLFVGRKKELAMLDNWIKLIPKRLGKSKALFSRRKGGKTSLVQRLFNRLWNENGAVIPIFFSLSELYIWLPDFAIKYYCIFASQYISFIERNKSLVDNFMTFEDIRSYGHDKSIQLFVRDIEALEFYMSKQLYDSMWLLASSAPKRFATYFDLRFLVIIDEFQYMSKYITNDPEKQYPNDSLPGTYHQLAETKMAPMLITGSYANWLNTIIKNYLEAGRVTKHFFSPYLAPDEGLEAVKMYSKFYNVSTTEASQKQINALCLSDPYFISCVIQSDFINKDLTTDQGVIDTVHYEISDSDSNMSGTWREYIDQTLEDINNIHAKRILLHMSKDPNRIWIPKELIDTLHLEISEQEVLDRLRKLERADLIKKGNADIEFKGLNDGTLHLVLRTRYAREIDDFDPDVRTDFKKTLDEMKSEMNQLKADKSTISSKYNLLKGQFAEHHLASAFKSKKRFSLLEFFHNVPDTTQLNIIDVRTRLIIQRPDGKNMEIDIIAESSCGRVVLVEIKNWKKKVGVNVIKDFIEKVKVYGRLHSDKTPVPCIWSKQGFSKQSIQMCELHRIAMADN
jgi:DNA-binding Lrp family transcriptional regulator